MGFSLMFTVVYLERMNMKAEKTKVVATRVTSRTAELIDEFCRRDGPWTETKKTNSNIESTGTSRYL